jgi:hypothetical protein
MGYFVTNTFTAQAQSITATPITLKVALLSKAPALEPNDSRADWLAVVDMDDLLALPGWEEAQTAGYARTNLTVARETPGDTTYLDVNTTTAVFSTDQCEVQAVAFLINPVDLGLGAGNDVVVLVSDTPFGSTTVLRSGDGISAEVDDTTHDWIVAWSDIGEPKVQEGPIALRRVAPAFETAKVQHAWMLPQRINFIANPSFEGGTTHWRTNGTLARASRAGSGNYPSPWVGDASLSITVDDATRFTPAERLYLLSTSFFPQGDLISFQMQVAGTGIVRVGLVSYEDNYFAPSTDWGMDSRTGLFQEWTLDSTNFTRISGLRKVVDSYDYALLIEVRSNGVDDPALFFDQVLAEEGALADWRYFDGDSDYGAPGDFTWYGNVAFANKQGKSYSLWYNNRRSVAGRLFGRFLDDDTLYTSADEQLDSLVAQWTPAGSVVVPHWDVLKAKDVQSLPQDKSAAPITAAVYPEQSQFFRIFSRASIGAQTVTLNVVGEFGTPVSGAVIEQGGTWYPATVAARPWDAAGLSEEEREALKAPLYDLSVTSEVTVDWVDTITLATATLYLLRGDEDSPSSWVAHSLA